MARTVLPLAGAFVGAFFGNPQLGYAIGSVIGNAVDPQRIKGPRIGDANVQTSQEGATRPIVYGTAAVMGNLIDRGPLNKVITEERQGKGGPVVESESLFMTFAIRICEGEIDGISRIWEDERLVYDVRSESAIILDSLRYAEGFTLYLGSEDQLPDPDLEAIHGIGNTPAHRGTAYIVFKEKNLTERRGSIPQFRFEVNGCLVSLAQDSTSNAPAVVRFSNYSTGTAEETTLLPLPDGTVAGDLVVVCALSSVAEAQISRDWAPDASEFIELDFGNSGAGAFGSAFAIVAQESDISGGLPVSLSATGVPQTGDFLIYSIDGAVVTPEVPLDVDSLATTTDNTGTLSFSYAGNFVVRFAFFQCRLSGTAGSYPFLEGQQTLAGSSARIYACFDVVPDVGFIPPTDWDRQGTSFVESAGVASVGLTV